MHSFNCHYPLCFKHHNILIHTVPQALPHSGLRTQCSVFHGTVFCIKWQPN